jgi:defect-in-organelle-trafficking protein DotD
MIVNAAKLLPVLLGFGLLAGCAASTAVPTDVATIGMPNAELALQRAIRQVNGDIAQIGTMQPAGYTSTETATPIVPAELQKPVQFVWSGPLDAGVKKLADTIGYTVAVFAPKNGQALAVSVSLDGQVLSAFQALGTQAGSSATVQVDPQHHQVQVIHHV